LNKINDLPFRRGASFALAKVSFFWNNVFEMRKTGDPPLRIVPDPLVICGQPSRPLGEHGRQLWSRVTAEYDVSDASGVEMLTLACEATDRIQSLSARILEDGETVRTPAGLKAHPLLKEELACRGFVVRTLTRLGLNFEPIRGMGRPPGRGA
jgi:hypothetical protein